MRHGLATREPGLIVAENSVNLSLRLYGRMMKVIRFVEHRMWHSERGEAKEPRADDGWRPFRNDSGEEIPAYAVMRQTGTYQASAYARRVMTMGKPNATLQRYYWVNGPVPVADDAGGLCTRLTYGGPVKYTGTAPAYGDQYGVTNGQWYLTADVPGFFIIGDPDDSLPSGIIIAEQRPPAGVWGTNDADLTTSGSQLVSLSDFSGMEISAFASRILTSGKKISSGSTVYVELDTYQVVNSRQCPVSV